MRISDWSSDVCSSDLGAQDKQSKAWLSECLASANWLLKALDQRARTIVKVSTEIVKQQDGFFRKGVTHLRPLTLRAVAEAIGMHESTVSRVTSNKYLACERGLRSEERRVGKECVRKCRSRWALGH